MSRGTTNDMRSIVITGAGQGLGRAFCLDLANRGYHVFVADIRAEAADRVAAEIASAGGRADAIEVDVASENSCAAALERIRSRTERLHGLVNNAAIFSTLEMHPFWEITVDEWQRVLGVNLTGAWMVSRGLLPLLQASTNARIVMVGASAVWFGRADYAHYVASKAGMVGLARAMARELAPFGIRVNTVTPGSVDTGVPRATVTREQRARITSSQLIKTTMRPKDVTGTVAFLLDDASAFITGQVLNVDGGAVTR